MLPPPATFGVVQRPPVQEGVDAGAPMRLSGGESLSHLERRVVPDEPEEARRQHIGGTVVCRLLIDETGHVTGAIPLSGPPLLRDAYVAAYRQWKYRPFLRDGKPVQVETTVAMNIQRNSSEPPPRVRVSGGVIASNKLSGPLPTLPQDICLTRPSGSIVMRVLIGIDGRIRSVTAISGPASVRQAYMDAVHQWTYRPFLQNGTPVEVETTVAMTIDINCP